MLSRILGIYKVRGNSMFPALSDNDFVITSRLFAHLRQGDLVVMQHPTYGRLIKRIDVIDSSSRIRLRGENNNSLSPDAMGWLDRKHLKGKVLLSVRAPTSPQSSRQT